MLPAFPNFKKLELSDQADIKAITQKYPPYSDFNFVSMWSWDVKEEMRISELNGNLVVRFTDYVTGEADYSFIGDNKTNETASTLLNFCQESKIKPILRLVPEISVKNLDPNIFSIQPDRDNFDYVIPAEIFIGNKSKLTKSKEKSIKRFLKKFEPIIKKLDVDDPGVKSSLLKLFAKWTHNKKNDPLEVRNELLAIERLILGKCAKDHICTGVFIEKELVSFCISQPLSNGYSTIHFCKADTSLDSGTYAHVLKENATALQQNGHQLINIEQDLGIESMRKWKMSHGDYIFLKKYKVRYNDKIPESKVNQVLI